MPFYKASTLLLLIFRGRVEIAVNASDDDDDDDAAATRHPLYDPRALTI